MNYDASPMIHHITIHEPGARLSPYYFQYAHCRREGAYFAYLTQLIDRVFLFLSQKIDEIIYKLGSSWVLKRFTCKMGHTVASKQKIF